MTSIRIVVSSIFVALSYPRVWLTIWFAAAVTAAVATYPFFQAVDQTLSHHPGATFLMDQTLDGDFARLQQGVIPDLTGATLLMLFTMTFFGGGILASVRTEQRFSYAEFITNSAHYLPRSLRALLLFVVPLFLANWGINALLGWLRADVFRNVGAGGPYPWLNVEFWLFALGVVLVAAFFYGLVFTYKIARAILVVDHRRSALFAWMSALGKTLRHPFRTFTIATLFLILYLGVAMGLGEATSYFLESQQNLLLGAAFAQLSAMWFAIVAVSQFVAARKFLASLADQQTAGERTVIIPSKKARRKISTKAEAQPVRS